VKIKIEIECTPEEARQFFGLPDLKPMQEAVMAKLQQQLENAIPNLSLDAITKAWLPAWLPFGGFSPEQLQKAVAGMMSGLPGTKPDPGKQP
jgi:hypothetical protein